MPKRSSGARRVRAAAPLTTTQFLQVNRAEHIHGVLDCVAHGHATGPDILTALGTGRYAPPAPLRRLTALRQVGYHTTAITELGFAVKPATRRGTWQITRAGQDWLATAIPSAAWQRGLADACASHRVYARVLAFVGAHPRQLCKDVEREIDRWYLMADGVKESTKGGAGPRRGSAICRILLTVGSLYYLQGTKRLGLTANRPGLAHQGPGAHPAAPSASATPVGSTTPSAQGPIAPQVLAPGAATPTGPVVVAPPHLPVASVPTGVTTGISTRRIGQGALRTGVLVIYGYCCAVCDERDPSLLVCSHVARWADDEAARGRKDNAICLCEVHDVGFEWGSWGLDDHHRVVCTTAPLSATMKSNIPARAAFRPPTHHPPHPDFLAQHRQRVGLAS